MNMQVGRVKMAPGSTRENARASRRLDLPTIIITGVAAWLSWRGWTALGRPG